MTDLHDCSFADWFGIGMELVPALIAALIVWGAVLALPVVTIRILLQSLPW